jgi:hypothetical protein
MNPRVHAGAHRAPDDLAFPTWISFLLNDRDIFPARGTNFPSFPAARVICWADENRAPLRAFGANKLPLMKGAQMFLAD